MKTFRIGLAAVCIGFTSCQHVAVAGSFTQSGLQALSLTGGAPPSVAISEMEPAAVVIFAPTSAGLSAVDTFVAWASGAGAAVGCPKFGVAVLGPEDSADLVSESLIQRKVAMPIFWSSREKLGALLGENVHGRVAVISGGAVNSTTFEALSTAASQAIELSKSPAAPHPIAPATPAPAIAGALIFPDPTEASAAAPTMLLPGVMQGPPPTETLASAPPAAADVVAVQTGLYTNMTYAMRVEFPTGIRWRESRRGDGALSVAEGSTSRLVWRIWCSPNTTNKDGQPGQMSALDYVRRLITVTANRLGAQPSFDKRFEISEGDDTQGRDYTYSITPAAPAAKVIGRVQAFESMGTIKAVSVEGTAEEFAANEQMIDVFFQSFTTKPTAQGTEYLDPNVPNSNF